ncbi:carboxypeptidase-like regulatory domain-containing protein [Pedobacter sp. WC2423]|uniref:carboxypeptidase-like regulatory domain-containing protein n=1 Tax=Pedobacter sp. WC2423 TaxID=3234142 RepID=UPI003465C381
MSLSIKLFLFCCLISFPNVYGQTKTIAGRIMSGVESVPYATIGVKGKNIGSVSDENGQFKIEFKMDQFSPQKDELIISCLGFADLVLPCKNIKLNEPLIVPLVKTEITLREVTVVPGKPKEKRYGKRSSAIMTSRAIFVHGEQINDALGREIGMIMKIDDNSSLKDFNVFVTGNQFKSVKFRLKFYDIGGNEPALIPLSKDIIFDVIEPKGWVKVDLRPYHIFLTGKEKIGVTMQWIESTPLNEKSRYFVISAGTSISSNGLYRPKSESAWTYPRHNLSMYLTADIY